VAAAPRVLNVACSRLWVGFELLTRCREPVKNGAFPGDYRALGWRSRCGMGKRGQHRHPRVE